jgi:hypothetical protein
MSGHSTQTTEHLIRSEIWSRQLKETFLEDLQAIKYVNWLSDFPDGDLIHIPSLGQAQVQDFEEGQAVKYTGIATGDFTFSITEYKSWGTYITDKMKQDSYYTAPLIASFVPKAQRALNVVMETDVLSIGPAGQTAADENVINGAAHRLVAQGAGGIITPGDFALARYALRKSHVPMTNLVAIVDPSVELTLSTMTNLVNVSNNKAWEGIVRDGITTGMRFLMNVYGFDVYTSDFLPSGYTETLDSGSVTSDMVANQFFSVAGGDSSPFIGAVRQAPRVESERNKDLQRDEYVMTSRYGFGFYRPENFVTIFSDVDAAVAAAS